MIHIKLNDNEFNVPMQGVSTLGELVEYVKSSIDPDTIIVSLTKDDQPLSEIDWRNPISLQSEMTLNFMTGSKTDFIKDRLDLGVELIKSFEEKIDICSQAFKQLRVHTANKEFSVFIDDLNAFVTWLHSIYSMDEGKYERELIAYNEIVIKLEKVCVTLQDKQMSSSWWALGDTLLNQMLPLIHEMKSLIEASKLHNN